MSNTGFSLDAICPSERACLTFVSMMSWMRRVDERSVIDPGVAGGTRPLSSGKPVCGLYPTSSSVRRSIRSASSGMTARVATSTSRLRIMST